MAAGRRGGYIDNEFKGRKADFRMSKKEIGFTKVDYNRTRKVTHEYERCQGRDNRIKQKDFRDREVLNVEIRSTSRRSESLNRRDKPRRLRLLMDREPGELLSDGSDGSSDLETQLSKESEVKMLENGVRLLPVQSKKRKFSPIVWDRNDRECAQTVNSRNNFRSTGFPPPPTMVDSDHKATNNFILDTNVPTLLADDSEVHASEASPSKIGILTASSEFPSESSSLVPDEPKANDRTGEIEDDDYVPTRTILSSRWANYVESPPHVGEISDSEDAQRLKRASGSKLAELKERTKSITPELGEVESDGCEGTRGRSSSGSVEHVSSSSRDDFHEKCDNSDCMEIDDCNYDANSRQSNTESDDDRVSSGTPEPDCPPTRSVNMLQGCRSVNEFERLNKIDEGTYGVVFRARDKKTGEIVALKKVKMEKEREGFPLTSLREINILLSFHHPSIVDVKEVVVGSNLDSIFMVMEYMEHDLKGLMETMKQPFSQSEVKCLMLQLLEGIKYLHGNWVLHRDLKTSNLLLNNCGELKICDFGLARQYGSPLKPYTPLVVTLWYRAPELLLGAKQYSMAIDMWSLGCIMAELLSKEPLFNGKTEVDQLDKIFKILGTPNEAIWPGLSQLPGVKFNFTKNKYNLLRKKFPATSFTGSPVLSDTGFDLLSKLLTYDPDKRITAEEALDHEWFREVPLPKSKEFMPTFPAMHTQDRRIKRMMKSPDPLEDLRRKELQLRELGNGGLFGQ